MVVICVLGKNSRWVCPTSLPKVLIKLGVEGHMPCETKSYCHPVLRTENEVLHALMLFYILS